MDSDTSIPVQHPQVPSFSGLDIDANKPFLPTIPQQKQRQPAIAPPMITSNDSLSVLLSQRLNQRMRFDEFTGRAYMPFHVLREIMTRDIVLRQLKSHPQLQQPERFLDQICPHGATVSHENTYTIIFAVLARIGRCEDIQRFVKENVSDLKLPLVRPLNCGEDLDREGTIPLYIQEQCGRKLVEACRHWDIGDRESFYDRQGDFMVHYFKERPNRDEHSLGSPEPNWVEVLHDRTYLPWAKHTLKELEVPMDGPATAGSQLGTSYAGGSYGSVDPYRINDTVHGFKGLLNSVSHWSGHFLSIARSCTNCALTTPGFSPKVGLGGNIFAVKTLRRLPEIQDFHGNRREESAEEMRERFYKEIHALWRLDGTVHEHLLTMLTAFVHQHRFNFVFPWAQCQLDSYWYDDTAWKKEAETFEWTLNQMHGLMGAIEKLHEPTHLHKSRLEPQDRFGLHADIKPDNILFFKSNKHPRGILILSDFGLASFHRQESRSNIPNKAIPGVPGYRPPECDIEGGTISRKYDIWTLGCLFLEMVTWVLGGKQLLKEFDDEADVLYITGGMRKMFYRIKEVRKDETIVKIRGELTKAQKPKVSFWVPMYRLRITGADYAFHCPTGL